MDSIWQDVWRLLSGPGLFRLGTLQTRRLIPVFYAIGLAAIVLWAISHLVFGLALGFAQGLWTIIEIAVFGALMLVGLRVVCEVLLIFFSRHEDSIAPERHAAAEGNLLDEVRDAIHDLADDDDDGIAPATDPAPYIPSEAYDEIEGSRPRTGRRN